MFRKLKIRLTLINIAVMSILFLLFITGTYFVMQAEIFDQSDQIMRMVATEAGSKPPGSPRSHDRTTAKHFYVKTDNTGNITEVSPDSPLALNQLFPLVQNALSKPRVKGDLNLNDQTYSYLKSPLETSTGIVLVFANVEQQRDILHFLLIALTAVGLASLVLAFYGSLFLAEKALVPVNKSWQRQKDFVADASHELRTPLAVIQTNLELVKGNPKETVESQTRWLDNIHAEAKRMTRLVDDLLFLARADSEQQQLDMEIFPLHKALLDAVNPIKPLATAQGTGFEVSLDYEGLLWGDENRIKQLVVILLDNALKNTPPGGRIGIKASDFGNEVKITVWDTGVGIAHEHMDRIFERFYRVDKARSKDQGGTGLGLSIAEWITKSHNGLISVTSSPGEGTTFTVNLPKPAA